MSTHLPERNKVQLHPEGAEGRRGWIRSVNPQVSGLNQALIHID